MTNENLPYRERESTFRLYESYVTQAIQRFPRTEKVRMNGHQSNATLADRIRAALTSLIRYNWKTDVSYIVEELRKIKVWQKPDGVYVGATDPGKHEVSQQVSNLTRSEIAAFALLIQNKHIPSLMFRPVTPEDLHQSIHDTAHLNIAITELSPGLYVIT